MKRGRSAESDQFYVPSSGEFPGEYDSGAENKRANTGNKENAQVRQVLQIVMGIYILCYSFVSLVRLL